MSYSSRRNIRRNPKGASILFLCLLIAFIVLPVMALMTFEIVRATCAHEQLQTACEAAALSGAAVLASSDHTEPMSTYSDLTTAALSIFRANSIYETSLAGSSQVTNSLHNPPAQQSSLFIELLNPNSSPANQPVQPGDTDGRVVHTVGSYGLMPVFGRFLGFGGPFTIKAEAHARVPQLDLVLCFDVSGSIDDQTPVTFVKRYWDPVLLKVSYVVTTARAGSPTLGGLAQGRLFDILSPPAEGTGVNALPPQNLDGASSSSNDRPLTFSASLRGSSNSGVPPGNYPQGSPSSYNAYTFTDLVVNLSEDANHCMVFPYTSPGGFVYPNIETVVEASRGNLESGLLFSGAKLNTHSGFVGVIPRAGYKADYLAQARKKIEPLTTAQTAAKEFFIIMNTNTEANFGLTCFATDGGRQPGETESAYNVANNYSAGGSANFAKPGIQLSKTDDKFIDVSSAIDKTLANGSTNIGDALLAAKEMLSVNSRPSARRAIIVLTDGQPTAPSTGSYPWSYARSVATQIQTLGIPIYTIGLAQNNEIVPGECNILNDDPNRTIQYTDTYGNFQSYTPGSGNQGISSIAGNRGKFFLVTNSSHLRYTFENIARQLVQMISVER